MATYRSESHKVTKSEIKMMGIVGPDYLEAKRMRRGRKALKRLSLICEEVGYPVTVPQNAEQNLRNAEIQFAEMELAKMTPKEILGNLSRFQVFTRE